MPRLPGAKRVRGSLDGTTLTEIAVLLLLAAGLIWPLFQIEYFDNWMSIDGGFISDAHFLDTHLGSAAWVPDFFCGNRLDYLYPPAIRYGTVAISRLFHMSTARAYHFYSALLYCLSPIGIYALLRAATRSRVAAVGAAAGALILSPVLAIFPEVRADSLLHMPQHLNIIVKWGEVAHMSSMSVLVLALAAAWVAIRGGRPLLLAAAAVLCALTVSFNLYGATALGILFPLMVWTLWTVECEMAIWRRASIIAALAWALTAWWMTPSFVALTARNLKLVAQPGNLPSRLLAVALIAVFAFVTLRLAHGRPERAWPTFLAGGVALFGLTTVGAAYFGFQALGDSHRFVPEFDLLLVLAAIECLRARWRAAAIAGAAVLAISLAVAIPYLWNPWGVFVADRHPERHIEYRLTDWLARNLPGTRVYAGGSVGFWSHSWRDIPQVGGVSDQGMENLTLALANWQLLNGDRADRDIHWLQALGAGAIVIHGPQSQEAFHAMRDMRRFQGRLQVLYDSGQDDTIYAVPRRYPALARVVDRRLLDALPPIPWIDNDDAALRDYAAMVEHGPEVAPSLRWIDARSLNVHAPVGEAQSVVIQETYDPDWHAWVAGRELPVRRDAIGFMRIDAPPGTHDFYLRFETPLEVRAGSVISALTFAGIILFGLARVFTRYD